MGGYRPAHQTQLDGSATQGEDCWVRTASMAVDFATYGGKVPSVKAIRDRADVPSGAGNTADQERAIESYDTPDETGGRQDLEYHRHVADPWGDLPVNPLTNAAKVVILSIDYGVVNAQKPVLSGDPNFDGNHSVIFAGSRVNGDGKTEVLCFDPLYDGRRSGIPQGPQWWPIWLAKEAAFGFAGEGKWTGGIIEHAYLLEPDEPDEPPPPTTEELYREALQQELTALREVVDRSEDRIATVEALLAPDTSQADAVVSSGVRAEA